MSQYRIFVEKKEMYATEAKSLLHDLNENLHLKLNTVRCINVYDVFKVNELELETAKNNVLSETVTDIVTDNLDLEGKTYFAIEFLPGQYDQRADSAIQCIQLLTGNDGVKVKSGKVIILDGVAGVEEVEKIKNYVINPIEMREKDLEAPLTLEEDIEIEDVVTYDGFIEYKESQLVEFLKEHGMAMSIADIKMIQKYFKKEERRNPTETELKVLDTYWSDHCRHTTFETLISSVTFESKKFHDILQSTFDDYIGMRERVHHNKKPMTLMDMATIAMKEQRKLGLLNDLEVSDEINACSVYIDVDVDGVNEPWLLMFKNETHNHPTEIEPFGGASTCIGGAIRDPLSGRSYVYQAMRVSGSANVLETIEETMEGKLPQKIISKRSADGNSSYGNQIGLPTSFVKEIYHDGYKAKHMEVGAVVGAVKASDVRREKPAAGDIIILLGGRTGRDGIGGATGSSKAHTENSIETASSEVQKGNAPTERKIQRLFRNGEVTRLIKKCNDFGAGGVAVAIGELADGLNINLNAVPVKYNGLNGTELAISESQERMAVLVAPADVEAFKNFAKLENLEATVVAEVTDSNRLVMNYNGKSIVNLSRNFLNTNGARQTTNVVVEEVTGEAPFKNNVQGKSIKEKFLNNLQQPNVASQQGMVEMFDSTIGTTTVLMPYGGKYQLTETEGSVHKIPLRHGVTNTSSMLTYGYNPDLTSWSPFHGSAYAVVESMAKIVALGGRWQGIRFSFQEYFRRLGQDPKNWGQPFSALLGSIYVQKGFNLPAIGGKDSMSGSFEDLHVPPTLISFAVQTEKANKIISSEFKSSENYIYLIKHEPTADLMPNIEQLKQNFDFIYDMVTIGHIKSAFTVKNGGIAEAIAKMSFGNKIGANIKTGYDLFDLLPGSFIVESDRPLMFDHAHLLGKTTSEKDIIINQESITIEESIAAWQGRLSSLYPVSAKSNVTEAPVIDYKNTIIKTSSFNATPQAFLPVFPGTNCEYDSARAFEMAGAKSIIDVFCNQNHEDIEASIKRMAKYIDESQILMLSGGFSAGDEPDGSGKFITSVLMNEQIRESIEKLLERDGLILGICNGFQALIKSGLLPYGKFGMVTEDSPTLVKNNSNRHMSKIIQTRIASNKSPWLSSETVGDIHNIAISHGEGKFVANDAVIAQLIANGQVATQYVDPSGNPTMDGIYNPNGSIAAIEGITSPDGRILGKMGHSERMGSQIFKNVPGNYDQQIFANGVKYFK
ncbi:MAG TPA: phosphoribosylformylglycinamidine synthase [Firmicutes bacterium]|nr:phosphoribosylformylglycinamidine synthase [Bacillota bacterium]